MSGILKKPENKSIQATMAGACVDRYIRSISGDGEGANLQEDFFDAEAGVLVPLYKHFIAEDGSRRIQEKEERDKVATLLRYISAGLGIANSDLTPTEEEKKQIRKTEEEGRTAALAEAAQKQEGLKVANAYRSLEIMKAQAGRLAKDPDAEEIASTVKQIMATRRAVGAQRNDKEGLMKAAVDPQAREEWMTRLDKNDTFNGFLRSMPPKKLAQLAADGHGGKLEQSFRDYVRQLPKIPADIPPEYMPTALERTEFLKSRIEKGAVLDKDACVELLASRAAVDSVRGKKNSLNNQIDPARLQQERERLRRPPLSVALELAFKDEKATRNAALTGHGGALEDNLKKVIRLMGSNKLYYYELPEVPSRFTPTYAQRMEDIQSVLVNGKLSRAGRMAKHLEYHLLAKEGKEPDKTIENYEDILQRSNKSTFAMMAVASRKEAETLLAAGAKGGEGFDRALSDVRQAHAGELKAAERIYDLDDKLAEGTTAEELRKIAAEKLVLQFELANFREKGTQGSLTYALSPERMTAKTGAMESNRIFKAMCDGMTQEELTKLTKANGDALIQAFDKTRKAMKAAKQQDKSKDKDQVKEDLQEAPEKEVQSVQVV